MKKGLLHCLWLLWVFEPPVVAKVLPVTAELKCPPGSVKVGQKPPDGRRQGCEDKSGKKVGVWTEWFDSGMVRQRGAFQNGQEEGPWVQWHANGELRLEGVFRQGQLHGEMRSYWDNGALNEFGTWQMGIAHGPTRGYFPSGELSEEGQYREGHKVGVWSRYLESGNLYRRSWFSGRGGNALALQYPETPMTIEVGAVNEQGPIGTWVRFTWADLPILFNPPPEEATGLSPPSLDSTRRPQ